MRTVAASIPVKAPADFAVAFLNSYIQEHLLTSSGSHLQLRLPLVQLARAATLEIDVTVHVTYLPSRSGKPPRLSIAWRPDNTHLIPSFEGAITAVSTEAEKCTLTIRGTYDAPYGIAGALFDAVLGVRIAYATLENLLQELRDSIEIDYFDRTKWDAPLVHRLTPAAPRTRGDRDLVTP